MTGACPRRPPGSRRLVGAGVLLNHGSRLYFEGLEASVAIGRGDGAVVSAGPWCATRSRPTRWWAGSRRVLRNDVEWAL